ncbi:Crp/Fnr family transcriptional regulator [Bernardetia sp. OM2101]|uniref:Crp/Fnr family transcriptional regulator n=1 Tax=Bernardetia sp. OM2101 TaxID=3344876 RepID=UPI0035CF7161
MKNIEVKKGEILQRSGELNTKVFIVKSGLLRSYTIDKKGKEHIFMFAPENWIITDNTSSEIPCDLYIDALEDTIITVREKKFEEDNIDVITLMKCMAVLQKRILMLMSSSAIVRYEHFVETYPQIIQRVPQKMIASYLGITPEALSKVKGDKARGL